MGGYIDVVSVIVRAAHVVAALLAEQLALSLREPGRADGTPEHRLILLLRRYRRFRFVHDDPIIAGKPVPLDPKRW
jgi:hypothetical protein